jgi:hypothetical protein
MSDLSVKKIRAIGAKNPDLDIEIPPHEFIDNRMDQGGGLNRKDVITEFESLYGNKLDVTRMEGGHQVYVDDRTELYYRAFVVALSEQRQAIRRALLNVKKASVSGPFIVGMQVDDGTVQFGKRPFKHPTLDKARKEAQRLQGGKPRGLTVFGAVEHIGRVGRDWLMPSDQVSVTKVYERRRTLGVILKELADVHVKGHLLSKAAKAIKTAGLSSDGSFHIELNDGEKLTLDNIEDGARYVDEWLTKHHAILAKRKELFHAGMTKYLTVTKHVPGAAYDPREEKVQTTVRFVEEIANIDWLKEWIDRMITFTHLAVSGDSLIAVIAGGEPRVVAHISGLSEEELTYYFPTWSAPLFSY